MEKNRKFGISSAAPDVDPRWIPDFAEEGDEVFGEVMGMHWANFLHYYPQNNLDRLGDWIKYFKRQSEIFGLMLSRDIRFTGNQSIYRHMAKLECTDSECTVDLTEALALDFDDLDKVFYISFKLDSLPKSCEGAVMELYEEKGKFNTYKVTFTEKTVKFKL